MTVAGFTADMAYRLGVRLADCGCCVIVDRIALRELVQDCKHWSTEYEDACRVVDELDTVLTRVRALLEDADERARVSEESVERSIAAEGHRPRNVRITGIVATPELRAALDGSDQ